MINRDKKIWIFNSGMSMDGNPKWLFMYIQKKHPEIKCYWFCYNKDCYAYVKKLGYHAVLFSSKEAERIGSIAGVYVVNQQKEVFQDYLKGITILNLWHGVGCKIIERGVTSGILNEGITKKNIKNTSWYQNNQLFLVTSQLMEKHFIEQCNLPSHAVLRGPYPNCFVDEKIETYDHDILKRKGLPLDTKIVVYAPTYRENSSEDFITTAIPDIEALLNKLKQNNLLLILKMHPFMEKDSHFNRLKQKYGNCSNLLFWNNADDIYEIFDKIDLAIVDYSSILYDMLAKGVTHVIRYIFDINNKENLRDFALDYETHSCGKKCMSFTELLDTLDSYDKEDQGQEIDRIKDLFWEYSKTTSIEDIVKAAIEFEPLQRELKTLYSFDIFDTLITRSTFKPEGIFRYVQNQMIYSDLQYSRYVIENYHKIRPWCEKNMREYYRKSTLYRKTDQIEITFDSIFQYMKSIYDLSDSQIEQLKIWELEAEYESILPCEENIELVKKYLKEGQDVVLISDMYLPKEVIRKMLIKADLILGELPLFVSSECGYQKTTKKLFYHVYHSLDYIYGKWIHYGDNKNADIDKPSSLGIECRKIPVKEYDFFEKQLIKFMPTFDGYQISKMLMDFRYDMKNHPEYTSKDQFAYCCLAVYFVPYINWCIKHAISHNIETLYFISRDGYHLKRIADAIIEEQGYSIKTKYIYGSRKAWRIPAFIDNIDEEFWGEFGNFAGVKKVVDFLEAAALTRAQFEEFFSDFNDLIKEEFLDSKTLSKLVVVLKNSQKYRDYLLDYAKEKRNIVNQYLKQEIDFNEKYAFVEYWGRGYTQTSLAKLLWNIVGEKEENIFYYMRSIYPSHEMLTRYNFTANNYSLIFIETIFANLHYKSINGYVEEENTIKPIIVSAENDMELQKAMERQFVAYAKKYVKIKKQDEDTCDRQLMDFGLHFFHEHPDHPIWCENFVHLKDSVAAYKDSMEWAPAITLKDIIQYKIIKKGEKFPTHNLKLSLKRSPKWIRKLYKLYITVKKAKKK